MTVENILIGESVYIVGHKKPDVDAIISAYAYQVYRHARGDFNYIAIRCDEPNSVTEWIFKETGFNMPRLVENVAGKKIVLVDHTDPEQRPNGWEKAEIIEVMDHHKLKLETSVPPKITIRPYGSTTTLVANKLLQTNVTIRPEFAQLMLSAILDDTLALRSPITTHIDKKVAGELSALSGISDVDDYAKKLFAKKDQWSKMSAEKIINTDIKSFEMGGVKMTITQAETMDNRKLSKRVGELQKALDKYVKAEGLDLAVLLLTDLLREDAIVISAGEKAGDLQMIFNVQPEKDGSMIIPGMLSRKKQMVPPLVDFYGAVKE